MRCASLHSRFFECRRRSRKKSQHAVCLPGTRMALSSRSSNYLPSAGRAVLELRGIRHGRCGRIIHSPFHPSIQRSQGDGSDSNFSEGRNRPEGCGLDPGCHSRKPEIKDKREQGVITSELCCPAQTLLLQNCKTSPALRSPALVSTGVYAQTRLRWRRAE